MQALADIPLIPAMTTDAERECYYHLTRDAAGKGAVIEFGAWLGASTAYIAAAMRDSGAGKAHVYDKFQSKLGHVRKVKEFYSKHRLDLAGIPVGDAYDHFLHNLGDLARYVTPHKCQIEKEKWGDEPIALIVNDAPKRIPAISAVLTNFREGIREGTVMAWQDFCHFPSYEIPACLYRLRAHFEFVEAVVPGTTLVFQVKSQWAADEVSLNALSLNRWTPDEITEAWEYWGQFIPAEKAPLFACGAAMFLCDIEWKREAVEWLHRVDRTEAVEKKWRYLRENRPDFVRRYAPLFGVMDETC